MGLGGRVQAGDAMIATLWFAYASLAAMQEGRKAIACEINPEYAAMAERRIAAAWLDGAE